MGFVLRVNVASGPDRIGMSVGFFSRNQARVSVGRDMLDGDGVRV